MSNIISILSVLVGAYLGHYFTVRQFNERSKKQKIALYNEVSIINEDYIGCFKNLIGDFQKPLKNGYSGVPFVSTRIIDNLMVELSSSKEVLSKDQRALLMKLERMHLHLVSIQKEKDVHVHAYLNEESKPFVEIKYRAAEQLVHIVEVIFYISKMLEERENFMFSHHKKIDMIHATCKVADINFDKSLWESVDHTFNYSD